MIVCDVTQFYSPFGGGVRRYLTEKRRFVERWTDDEHVLIVPGARTDYVREGRLHTYTIKSPPVSSTSRYRVLLNQGAVRDALRRARPDIVESGDPYQVAWTTIREARGLGVPVVGFYHSHFPEAYLRTAAKFGGPLFRDAILALARRYVRKLYNEFDVTFVCAQKLQTVLRDWGVETVRPIKLGIDAEAFRPGPPDPALRARLGIPETAVLLLYVGRLAGEKNIQTLLAAFERLRRHSAHDYRLVCVGQGPWREQLLDLRERTGGCVTWIPHISDSAELARLYRAADLAVHPSVNETFGLVPLEEQACGLPVCGIRGSCLDENILAGLECWADTNRPAHLAAAIERMRRRNRADLGGLASAIVRQRYAWPVVLNHLWEEYRSLANHSARKASPEGARIEGGREIRIRSYQPRDRAAVRRICCETGFLGSPIDTVFEDRELFADYLTGYYSDYEPESLFVLECDGQVAGYLCGCRHSRRREARLLWNLPRMVARIAWRYFSGRYNASSRRYVRWLATRALKETPPRPPRTPHFHVNVLPAARSMAGTKALIDAFLAYLRVHGETAVYGQMVVYEDRRTDALFSRFGFVVLNRREITKYQRHFPGRVFLCTAWKDLSQQSRLHGARIRFLSTSEA